MSEIIKSANDAGFRARADRRITQGLVVSKDETTHTCILDVGAYDANEQAVYLHDIPYQPQTPPQVNDTVSLLYSNVSPHSLQVAGGQVGGGNSGQTVAVAGAVSSLRTTGEASGQQGDITLDPGANMTITRTGTTFTFTAANSVTSLNTLSGALTLAAGTNVTITQAGSVITIDASGGGSGSPATTAPVDIASAAATGTDTTHYALADHTHQGVHSLNTLLGDVNLVAGANVSITPSGTDLIIASSGGGGGGGGVTSLNLVSGALTLTGGTGIVVSAVGTAFTITAQTPQTTRVALDYGTSLLHDDTGTQTVFLVLDGASGFTASLEFGATINPTNSTDSPGTTTQQVFHVLNMTSNPVAVSTVSGSITLMNVAASLAVGASATYVCVRTAANTYQVYQF